jgi:ubiquinone/menaquinone biosynthesis C-methylase UbiE
MPANYDRTVWFYDRLSKLVFGQAQVKAQNYFLDLIPPHSSILIVGGGTGQILEALAHLHPHPLKITYAEASANMMALSKKRNAGQNEVTYVQSFMEDAAIDQTFDVILTAFLFDNFDQAGTEKIFKIIHDRLRSGGLWLDTDLQLTGPLWQKILLKTMYIFFNTLKAVDVNQLPDTASVFAQNAYQLQTIKEFYGRLIVSKVYRKPGIEPPQDL